MESLLQFTERFGSMLSRLLHFPDQSREIEVPVAAELGAAGHASNRSRLYSTTIRLFTNPLWIRLIGRPFSTTRSGLHGSTDKNTT